MTKRKEGANGDHTTERQRHLDRMSFELAMRTQTQLEERMASVPAGYMLCVHSPTYSSVIDRNDDTMYTVKVSTHVLAVSDMCDEPGPKYQVWHVDEHHLKLEDS